MSTELDMHLEAEHQILDNVSESANAWQSLQRNPNPGLPELAEGNKLAQYTLDTRFSRLCE